MCRPTTSWPALCYGDCLDVTVFVAKWCCSITKAIKISVSNELTCLKRMPRLIGVDQRSCRSRIISLPRANVMIPGRLVVNGACIWPLFGLFLGAWREYVWERRDNDAWSCGVSGFGRRVSEDHRNQKGQDRRYAIDNADASLS